MTWLRRTIIVLLIAGFVTMLAKGANRPANPYLRPANPPAPGGSGVRGRRFLPRVDGHDAVWRPARLPPVPAARVVPHRLRGSPGPAGGARDRARLAAHVRPHARQLIRASTPRPGPTTEPSVSRRVG